MSSSLPAPDHLPRLDAMARFDALPPAVRRAISGAAFSFHPAIAERILRRGTPESRCIAAIEAADRRISGGARS